MLDIAPELLSVLGVGLVIGLRHAFEPDHLVVVTTLATRQGRVRDACRLGLAWGVGHSATVAAFVLALLLFDLHLPNALWPAADFLVGVLLVALGAWVIASWARGRFHVHAHRHGDEPPHVHLHGHAAGAHHAHAHPRGDARRSFAFGLLHGLAGSAAILVLIVAATGERAHQLAHLAAFVAGSIAGMLAVSLAMAAAVRFGSRGGERWTRALHLASAAASVAVGLLLAVETARELG